MLFCCVDSIETRRIIWEAVKTKADFYCDGPHEPRRSLRVLTAADPAGRKHYPTTLFAAGEAYAGPCTAKSTIFCANIAAGLMVLAIRSGSYGICPWTRTFSSTS